MNPAGSLVRRGLALLAAVLALRTEAARPPAATPWQAGVARRNITPTGPIWLAGYANRSAPSTGVESELFAKALALDDGAGGRVVIVTLDLIRVPKALRDFVEREAGAKFGLQPREILLNSSHTHSGPEVEPERMTTELAFSRTARPADVAAVQAYEGFLRSEVLQAIGASLAARAPARLDYSHARAGFAMNRRRPDANGSISNNPHPDGPVDHDVPVLRISGADGKVRALLFGYACHNTTLGGSVVSADYAGHAQRFLEAAYPGTTALFVLGAGGDQNPYPRGNMVPGQTTEESAQQHGRALANAVHTALASRAKPVAGPLRTAFGPALLDYVPLPAAELAKYSGAAFTPPVMERARTLLRMQERGEKPAPLACPVQVLRFGEDLTFVAIGGEVVVDYALRLKREIPGNVWVAGYSNHVFGYLPGKRVVQEGGYEGISANTRILIHPGRFTDDVEDRVVGKVHELVRSLR